MAKLSAHGKEVGRINYTTYAKAYMQDGVVLKNEGHGWKVYGSANLHHRKSTRMPLTTTINS
jgi:hypothetical protein